ncbi:DUF6468 domain-containing protein [Gymnodinialimonas hymeniacidonis]|uniref:DUF6468 domain-containing protein n=1 Tax=Gymnodinialimonas hymeniacidonis TaxID=3126508 RepID=UPI0034C658BE
MTFFLTYGADLLVILASLGAMGYCIVLSRRLNRLTSFDKGLGGAIAVMSSQVDEMKAALREAKAGSDGAGQQLHELVHQARDISTELEMMIAACHDFAEDAIVAQSLPTASQQPAENAEVGTDGLPKDAEDTSEVTPIFGTRRMPATHVEQPEMEAPALFRHHNSLAS